MSYAETLAGERRLEILALLVQGGGAANDRVLLASLKKAGLGARLTHAGLQRELEWLAARGLAVLTWVEDLMAVKLTERGGEVATGCEAVKGIAAPPLGSRDGA